MDFETTTEGVNRLYSDHLASLRMWGGDFDEVALLVAWDDALSSAEG